MQDNILLSINHQGIYTYETAINKLGIGKDKINVLVMTGGSYYGNTIQLYAYKVWMAYDPHENKIYQAITLEELAHMTGLTTTALYYYYQNGNGRYVVDKDYIRVRKKEVENEEL